MFMFNVDFNHPYLSKNDLLRISRDDINNYYATASELDRFNLFFIFLTTLDIFEQKKDTETAAVAAYLLSYYVFVPLTPPGSEKIAIRYARKAFELNPLPDYAEWIEFVRKGN